MIRTNHLRSFPNSWHPHKRDVIVNYYGVEPLSQKYPALNQNSLLWCFSSLKSHHKQISVINTFEYYRAGMTMLGVISLKYITKQKEYADVKGSKSYFIFLRIKQTSSPKSTHTHTHKDNSTRHSFHGEWKNLVIKGLWHKSQIPCIWTPALLLTNSASWAKYVIYHQ